MLFVMKKRNLYKIVVIVLIMVVIIGITFFAVKWGKVTPVALDDIQVKMWVEPSDENRLPARINVFVTEATARELFNRKNYTYTCLLCLPGGIDPTECYLSWDRL